MGFANQKVEQLFDRHLDKSIKAGNGHNCAKCGTRLTLNNAGGTLRQWDEEKVVGIAWCRDCNMAMSGNQILALGKGCAERRQLTLTVWRR
jgi:hypothetical protein